MMKNKITPNKTTRIQVNNIKYTYTRIQKQLKGVFAKNERGYRLNAIKKLF